MKRERNRLLSELLGPIRSPKSELVIASGCARYGTPLRALTVALFLCGLNAHSVWARDYFDSAFLNDGSGTPVDLSAYETAGATPEGEYLVDVYMNQQMSTNRQVRFAKDAKGNVAPELTPAMLEKMGVLIAKIPAFNELPPDKPVGDLKALIPDATVRFDIPKLRLDITVPQIYMDKDVAGRIDPKLLDSGVPAMVLGYSLSGSKNWMDGGYGANSTSQSLFGSVNGGINLDAWRLRSNLTMSSLSMSSGNYHSRYSQTQFSNTYLQRDIQALQSYLTLGETSTGSDIFNGIPFRGVRMVSTEDMMPASERGFAPVVTGTASSNARVTVEQNGYKIYETTVPPGPFRLTDIYNAGNGAELVVTVTEEDGTRHVSTLPYSSLPLMKRPGRVSYDVSGGQYRNGGYTSGSADPMFLMATAALGLPQNITLYGGVLGAERYRSVALGTGVSLGSLGALSADATLASTDLPGGHGKAEGGSFRVRYSKSMTTTGTSVDLSTYRYSTNEFFTFQEAMAYGYSLREGYAPWLSERQRSSWQVNISQRVWDVGSLYVRASQSDYWGSSRTINSVGAGFGSSIKGVGYSVNYSVDHVSRDDGNEWPVNRQVSLNVSVPFSIFSPQSDTVRNISANYSMTRDNQGRMSQQAGMSGSLLDNRLSWGVSGNDANQGGGRSGNLNLGWSGSQGNMSMGYGYSSSSRTLSANASGGVVVHPHGVTLTPTQGDTLALVSAPGAGGVRVMNGYTATDSRGYGVSTFLQPYQRNVISLDPTTLPDGVDVADNSVAVYPTRGAVVEAKFKTRVGRQAMLTLKFLAKPVPFGATASLVSDETEYAAIVGDGGMVYLTGAPQKGTLNVQWGREADQRCRVDYDLGPLPEVGKDGNPVAGIVQQSLTCQAR